MLAIVVDGEWRPGIGDPTVLGWITVAAYFAAMLACWRAAAIEREVARRTASPGSVFWWSFALLLLLLGVNKQLDLQTWLTIAGRRLAKEQGWYAQRMEYQIAFIFSIGVAALLLLAVLCWMSRRRIRRRILALAGGVFLAGFVVIRALSVHTIDHFLGTNFVGMRWNWILELGGIALVGLSAVHNWRAGPGPIEIGGGGGDTRAR
jgi:hypothetical protein